MMNVQKWKASQLETRFTTTQYEWEPLSGSMCRNERSSRLVAQW